MARHMEHDFDKNSHPVLAMLRTNISGRSFAHRCKNCGGGENSHHCENHKMELVELPKRVKHAVGVPENFATIIREGIE